MLVVITLIAFLTLLYEYISTAARLLYREQLNTISNWHVLVLKTRGQG